MELILSFPTFAQTFSHLGYRYLSSILLGYKESDGWEEIASQVRNLWKFSDNVLVQIWIRKVLKINMREGRKMARAKFQVVILLLHLQYDPTLILDIKFNNDIREILIK